MPQSINLPTYNRRDMKKHLVNSILCLSILIYLNSPLLSFSTADSCIFPQNYCEIFNGSNEVVLANIVKKVAQKGYWEYHLNILKIFKGSPAKEIIALALKDTYKCSLGPDLKENEEYLIYISISPDGARRIYLFDGGFTKPAAEATQEIKLFNSLSGKNRISLKLCRGVPATKKPSSAKLVK